MIESERQALKTRFRKSREQTNCNEFERKGTKNQKPEVAKKKDEKQTTNGKESKLTLNFGLTFESVSGEQKSNHQMI